MRSGRIEMNGDFRLGRHLVQPHMNRIVSGFGRNIPLEPKVMDVLVVLAAQPGEVVPREVILDEVWPNAVVCDHVLTRCICLLRKALGDDVSDPRFIQTIAKRGYRLRVDPVPLARRPAPAVCRLFD